MTDDQQKLFCYKRVSRVLAGTSIGLFLCATALSQALPPVYTLPPLIRPAPIHRSVSEMQEERGTLYAILVSGPQMTDDIEGIVYDVNDPERLQLEAFNSSQVHHATKQLTQLSLPNLQLFPFITPSSDQLMGVVDYVKTTATKHDTVLFAFYGHGGANTLSYSTVTEELLSNTSVEQYVNLHYQDLQSLANEQKGNTVFLIDACSSGAFADNLQAGIDVGEQVTILSSTIDEEQRYYYPHSFLTSVGFLPRTFFWNYFDTLTSYATFESAYNAMPVGSRYEYFVSSPDASTGELQLVSKGSMLRTYSTPIPVLPERKPQFLKQVNNALMQIFNNE